MDLQTRKLMAIEYLIGIRDEKIFSKIESTIVEVQKTGCSQKCETSHCRTIVGQG